MRKISRHGIQGTTFGVMEAAIMMLGVLLGLSVTGNRLIISIGMISAGIADALANSASFYVSEQSEMIHTKKEIWKSTWRCFIGTLLTVIALTIPIILIPNFRYSIVASFAVGLVILLFLGRYMANKLKSKNPGATIVKYVLIGIGTAIVCFIVGVVVNMLA